MPLLSCHQFLIFSNAHIPTISLSSLCRKSSKSHTFTLLSLVLTVFYQYLILLNFIT